MNLTKCSNGHFYDSDTYASCPHCGGGGTENVTIPFSSPAGAAQDVGATMPLTPPVTPDPPITNDYDNLDFGLDDDAKTISIYQNAKVDTVVMAPTVGWLVCTKGKFYGQDFRLKSGRNFIGRGAGMDVMLAGENTVSRDRHATIIHEPRQNIFIAQPGESRELFYVNGNVVLSPVQLKKNDILQIGEVCLMLIPCCDDVFNWDKEEDN